MLAVSNSILSAACIALTVIAGILAFRVCIYQKSLDKLIEQLHHVQGNDCYGVEVYSRDHRIVALAKLINSEHKRSQETLEQKDDDLDRLNEELAFFSHDIRTPVAVIQGYMELLEADADEGHRYTYLAKIREKLIVMREMIDELCDYSVIAASAKVPLGETVVVYNLLCSVLADYYEAFSEKGWEPHIVFDDEDYRATCPEGDLRRVLSNLMGNVLKYGAAGPQIVLRGNVLHVSNKVTNPADIDTTRMFERFWRGDPSRTGNGSGLGLAVARTLCERMGVDIAASIRGNVLDVALTFSGSVPGISPAGGRA